MTADKLLQWPDDGQRHELLKGKLLSYPYCSAMHGFLTAHLICQLSQEGDAFSLGRLLGPCGFKLESNPDTVLVPDIAFTRIERAKPLSRGYPDGSPDLVIEVLEQDDDKSWVKKKCSHWFDGGASVIWLVNPSSSTVEVLQSSGQSQVLEPVDELSGGELLPTLRVPVSQIFSY